MVGHGAMWVGGVSSSLWRKAILSSRSSFRCTKVPDLIFATSFSGTGGNDGDNIIGAACGVGVV